MHQGRATPPLLGGLVLIRACTLAEPFTSAQLSILQQVPYFNEQLHFRRIRGVQAPLVMLRTKPARHFWIFCQRAKGTQLPA